MQRRSAPKLLLMQRQKSCFQVGISIVFLIDSPSVFQLLPSPHQMERDAALRLWFQNSTESGRSALPSSNMSCVQIAEMEARATGMSGSQEAKKATWRMHANNWFGLGPKCSGYTCHGTNQKCVLSHSPKSASSTSSLFTFHLALDTTCLSLGLALKS